MNKFKKVSILAASLVIIPVLAFAWQPPSTNPPDGNVSEPLNASANAQSKLAGLWIAKNAGITNGLLVEYGNVGIGPTNPQYRLQVGGSGDGSSVASNAFFYLSDATLKKDVETLTGALGNILKLRGVSFRWNNPEAPAVNHIGVIAQEVEKVYPEAVSTNPVTGMKSVEYGNLVAPLIEAVKAQQTQIEELKARIAVLEARQ